MLNFVRHLFSHTRTRFNKGRAARTGQKKPPEPQTQGDRLQLPDGRRVSFLLCPRSHKTPSPLLRATSRLNKHTDCLTEMDGLTLQWACFILYLEHVHPANNSLQCLSPLVLNSRKDSGSSRHNHKLPPRIEPSRVLVTIDGPQMAISRKHLLTLVRLPPKSRGHLP